MRQALFLIACASALGIAAVGCGGGGGVTPKPVTSATPTVAPTATPTATPIPLPSQTPYVVQAVATLPPATPVPQGQTPAPVPVALPTGGPVSGSMSIATSGSAIAPGTQVATQLQNTPPGGVPALDVLLNRTSYARGINAQSAPAISVITYLYILFNEDVLLSQAPSFTFALPSSYVFPGANYYLALYNPNLPALGWQLGFEGPGTVSGSNVTFNGGSSSMYFQAWTAYYLGLYAVPASAAAPTPAPSSAPTMAPTVAPSALPTGMPTPTPTPSPAPNPTPTPAFEVLPSSLSFNGTGLTQTFSAIDLGYSGTYTATSSDSKVATVSVSGSTFTVTSVAAGTATITVSESNGKTATCTVTVTTTTIPIN